MTKFADCIYQIQSANFAYGYEIFKNEKISYETENSFYADPSVQPGSGWMRRGELYGEGCSPFGG